MKNLLFILILIAVSFLIGYSLRSPKIITEVQKKQTGSQYIPECFLGRCPIYETWDTDGDYLAESVVLVATAMTKGAGKVLIIDEGNIVFNSGEAPQISYKIPKDTTGIIISYAKEFKKNGIEVKTWATNEYHFENGNYILTNTIESPDSFN